jgi:DNA-binding transcriptional LysR family regulator
VLRLKPAAQIQSFAPVAEVNSFTLDSEQLGMTQSAVSHAVTALEKELQATHHSLAKQSEIHI